MGRGKLRMELIKNEKARFLTYRKRLKGLMKKAYEFTTLCGVKACMIIYGPKLKGDSSSTLTIWPSDGAEVKAVIGKYRDVTVASGVKGKKAFDLVDYFAVKRRMVNEEITKVQKANSEAKFPSWNNGITNLSLDQIRVLIPKFDSKIEAAKREMKAAKRDGYLVDQQFEDMRSEVVPKFPNFQSNLKFEVLKPDFDTQLFPYQPFTETTNPNQQFRYNINPVETPMMALLMHGELNSGASSSIDSGIANAGMAPVFAGSGYHDLYTTAMFDNNEVMNNHWAVPVRFCQPPLQHLPVQYQAAPYNVMTPQPIHDPWYGLGEYCVGMNEVETKNKKQRF